MKKLIYILLGGLLILGCEDVVDIEVPSGKPRLTIDASFELYTKETPVITETEIRLTLSSPFFDKGVPPVRNAVVFIKNLNDNAIINFEESDEPGFYTPVSGAFIPDFDIDYELSVIYDNQTYKAVTQLMPTVPLDNIAQGDKTLFEGDETEIIITYTDNGNRNDFYLIDLDMNLFLASEDRLYQGDAFKFSYFYDDLNAGKEITIKLLGIDEQYYNYMNLIITQSEDSGNPFMVIPATLRGNFINTTNADNYALGYFSLSEVDQSSITTR